MSTHFPKIAIVDPNTLASIGLKQLLQSFMPIMVVETFGSMSELTANNPDDYVHYFVAMNVVLEHRAFFVLRRNKTIVLTMQTGDGKCQLSEFNSICVNVPESELVRSLIRLEQHAHGDGRNLPTSAPRAINTPILSDREAEVMVLIVQGFINKEIAEQLHIALATVVTHRKNIMEKLGLKSVSALTIYAVMNGYIDINKI